MTRLGVIADDFTGATDIAGFLTGNGMTTVMYNGVPAEEHAVLARDAMVVSLKIRSCSASQAVEQALLALKFLQAAGCSHFFYKYCSTFDSTAQGNIGPVTDALKEALNTDLTVVCPALPVNGRTIYHGHLFVGKQLLSDSSMRFHPITPMLDSNLVRLMEAQAEGRCTLISYGDIKQGPHRMSVLFDQARKDGFSYVVTDVVDDGDLDTIATAVRDFPLVTGGSGLAIGVAKQFAREHGRNPASGVTFMPKREKTVILAGSCSAQTNKQVRHYLGRAPSLFLDAQRALEDETYAQEVSDWVVSQTPSALAPLVYATKTAAELEESRRLFGDADVAEAIERVIGVVAAKLAQAGFRNFICAGGETSGAVAQALALDAYDIGPHIDPGVSWIRSLDGTYCLALKSGNFGAVDFFEKAQGMYDE